MDSTELLTLVAALLLCIGLPMLLLWIDQLTHGGERRDKPR